MLVDRKRMIEHLTKIYTSNQIKEAVLTEAFSCNALNADGQLLIVAPSLKGIEPLPEPVGLVDVDLFISALKSLSSSDEVAVDFEDERILVDSRHGGRIRLLTAATNLIQSAVKQETVDKVLETVPDKAPEVPLSQDVIKGVLDACSLVKPEIITLKVGKKASEFVVGQTTGHYVEHDLPAKTAKGEQPYELIFAAKLVIDVFRQLTDYTSTKITLTGPDSIVVVSEGAYRYVISPQEPA